MVRLTRATPVDAGSLSSSGSGVNPVPAPSAVCRIIVHATITSAGVAASDPLVREAMSKIAPDEASHAELAIAVDQWALSQLDTSDRTNVETARTSAVAELRVSALMPVAKPLQTQLGIPDSQQAEDLLDRASERLWSTAA